MGVDEFPAKSFAAVEGQWILKEFVLIPSVQKGIANDILNADILDVGCGSGFYESHLLKWGARSIYGVDASQEMVDICRQKFSDPRLSFSVCSAAELNMPEQFDLATAIHMLQFTETLQDLKKALEGIYRSLKPGGKLFACIPNGIANLDPEKADMKKMGGTLVVNEGPRYDGERIRIDFYNGKGEKVSSASPTFYFCETYEKTVREVGFCDVEWFEEVISPEGITKYGEEFFRPYVENPPGICFKATKPL